MIGIVPAGGKAERMGGIPKMLLPTPRGLLMDILMERMEACNLTEIVVGANHEWDRLAERYYHRARFPRWQTETMTEMVLRAPGTSGELPSALFGMPDTFFEDEQAFHKLLNALDSGADVAVGLFETRPEQRHKLGMCICESGQVVAVVDKPTETRFIWAWGVLAWKPTFWQHLRAEDPHVGYGLPRAITAGLDVRAVEMDGQYWDCGTPDEYFDLIHHLREGVSTHAP